MNHSQKICRSAAILTAAALTVVSLPTLAVSSVEYNTWTGYVLRDDMGNYLSVPGGTESEGLSVGFYEADGAAPYNTWYFTETELGITIKSALSEGQYYLAEADNGSLCLSVSPSTFDLSKDGILSAFRSGVENPIYAKVTPEAVTNLHAGDMNQDGALDGTDLTILRQLTAAQNADFVQNAIGDLDGNGTLTGADAALLQRYLLGESLSFPEPQIPACSQPPTPANPVVTETTPAETTTTTTESTTTTTETTASITTTTTQGKELTVADMPSEYAEPMEWIWENRINDESEGWVSYWDTIYDQIVAEDGHLYYVVKWQSYNTLSLTQRQQIEDLLDDTINAWTDWLVGYDNWPYDHVDVEIVGWAVLDKSLLLDLQDDEIVYTDTTDNTDRDYIIESNMASDASIIPTIAPYAPSSLYRYDNYWNPNYVYGENHFDMYLQGVQGMTDMGGFGWGWGQELSDTAILSMAEGNNSVHILEHEMGHGFGLPDFYGGEGESDGYPPGGFPDSGTSIMMAGSSMEITDFDGWMLRYAWSKISDESGRFFQ